MLTVLHFWWVFSGLLVWSAILIFCHYLVVIL